MNLSELYSTINGDLISQITSHEGLSVFASEKAKFEGWLKVELINILKKKNQRPIPETNWVDIVFDNIAIELKTINTNYKFDNVNPKTKPITDNTGGIIQDIEKLKRKDALIGFVVFVVFPCQHENKFWQKQFQLIEGKLKELVYQKFTFANGIPGVIYYGKI
jgi:hypothetical protein